MQKLTLLLILFLALAGCLDAKLSNAEAAACMRASGAELSHIQPCTTATACQTLFRKTQPLGIGTKTNSSIQVERAEREAINAWARLTDATQKLQKVRAACTNGTIGTLWDQSQQAGTALGEALLHSERSQIYSWQALQQTVQEAGRMELGEVRDSKAFEAHARAAELIQEVKTQNPRSPLAQKVQENTQYFAGLANKLSGKESTAYEVDISSGFDLLKTPIKILEPGNTGKLIVAFFPTWNSFLNAMRTRKNAVKGVQVLEELVASEMVYHTEVAVAPQQGIHAALVQHIRAIEEGIGELQEEETKYQEEVPQKMMLLEQEIAAQAAFFLKEKNNYGLLSQWSNADANNSIEKQNNSLHVALQQLNEEKDFISGMQTNTPLGKRISAWRKWQRHYSDAQQKIKENELLQKRAEKSCQELANKFQSSETEAVIRLVSKEVIEASREKVWEYCATFLHQLQTNNTAIKEPAFAIMQKENLAHCVQKTNDYVESMQVGSAISSEEWMIANQNNPSLALTACKSALQNMETAYDQSTIVVEWNSASEQAQETLQLIQSLQLNGNNGAQLKAIKEKIQQQANSHTPQSFSTLQKNKIELEKTIAQAQTAIRETLQEMIELRRWSMVFPHTVKANELVDAHIQWQMDNPIGKRISFPLTLRITPPANSNVIESNVAWNQNNDKIILSLSEWNEPISIEAEWNATPVQTTTETTVGELIGNQARVQTTIRAIAEADATLQLELVDYGFQNATGITIRANDHATEHFTASTPLIALSQAETEILIRGILRETIISRTIVQSTQEQSGLLSTAYEVTWENQAARPFTLSASTGIHIDPIETLSVNVTGEQGETISWSTSGEGSLVIRDQTIAAHGTRTFNISVTQAEGSESWQILKENILQQVSHYTQSSFASIAAKAIALLHRIEQWNGESDSKKWAEGLQKWQSELDALAQEENTQWQKKAALTARGNSIVLGETAEWERQRATFDSFLNQNNLAGAETVVAWLEQNDANTHKQSPLAGEKENKNEVLEKASQLNQEIINAREAASAYASEQGITCSKLLETNFICPLSENQLKDLKADLDGIQKDLREVEKQMAKKDITDETIRSGSETIQRLAPKLQGIAQRISEARKTLKEHAEQLSTALKEYPIATEEWKENIAKVNQTIQSKEYGKAIYVGRSLLEYAESQKKNITGLSTLPEKTLPFLGIIFAVGSMGLLHWWKRKKQKPVELKSIPRAESVIHHPLSETKNDEPMLQAMRKEPPAAQPTQTTPAPQSLPMPKKS